MVIRIRRYAAIKAKIAKYPQKIFLNALVRFSNEPDSALIQILCPVEEVIQVPIQI